MEEGKRELQEKVQEEEEERVKAKEKEEKEGAERGV
jgi:hypothetical protein